MRLLAQQLIAHGAAGEHACDPGVPAVFPACETLREPLATLMGDAGHRGLLARALALAGMEVRWLRAVHVRSDGSLEGLNGLRSQLAADEYREGEVELLTQLLGLLKGLIGEDMTVRILRELWPKLPLEISDGGEGDET